MKTKSILICILFAITANSFITAKAQAVNANDSLALVDLYNSTNGPHWSNNTNWLTANPVSTWHGIKVANNRVTNLSLESNKLSGTIPPSIGNLTNLAYLDLIGNKLTGTIPSSIGNLVNLTFLNLGNNKLSGTIPPSISNLINLTFLDLNYNQLTGIIPSSISNLTNLTFLNLSSNKLTGTIPSSIGNLVNLTELDLNEDGLSGTIPATIGNLTNLTTLELFDNQLSGTIPASLGNLANLTYLSLNENDLSGAIPVEIGNLKKLKALDLDENLLTGTIPGQIGKLKHLTSLILRFNQLSGAVPASLDKLKNCNIDLRGNKLSQLKGFNASKDTNYQIRCNIENNLFTFTGLETVAKKYINVYYALQDTILPIHQSGGSLSVYAGGTLINNTYKWHQAGKGTSTIIQEDSTFTPAQSGRYYVSVTNKVANQLTLHSDTINFVMPAAKQSNTLIANAAQPAIVATRFAVYPNPATNTVHIQTSGTADIVLTNSNGKVLLTKTINNTDAINISQFANGTYYIQNKTTGEVQKIVVVH